MKLPSKLLAGWIAALTVYGQPPAATGVDPVNLWVTVRNGKGALAADLAPSDIRVYENDVERPIRAISRVTGQRLTIGVLVDVSRSVTRVIEDERRAALQFFKQVLRPEDKGFIIGFAGKAMLLQDATSSLPELQAGLAELNLAADPPPSPKQPSGIGRPRTTVFYDAVFLAADEVLQPISGRKVIILLTDGRDQGSLVTEAKAIEALFRTDTIVYAIHSDGMPAMPGGPPAGYVDGWDFVEALTKRTGGRTFRLSGRGRLEKIYAEIEEELRSQYSISFTPGKSRNDGALRRIEVEAVKKGYKVQAREGYYR